MATKLLEPIPPGEILSEEFMKPLELSINALAREIDVPPNRISEIVGGKRSITADSQGIPARGFHGIPQKGYRSLTITGLRP